VGSLKLDHRLRGVTRAGLLCRGLLLSPLLCLLLLEVRLLLELELVSVLLLQLPLLMMLVNVLLVLYVLLLLLVLLLLKVLLLLHQLLVVLLRRLLLPSQHMLHLSFLPVADRTERTVREKSEANVEAVGSVAGRWMTHSCFARRCAIISSSCLL